jgi:hypothetical protein
MLQGRISGPLHGVGLSQGQHIAYKVLHKAAPEGPDAVEAGTVNVDRFLSRVFDLLRPAHVSG